MLQLFPPALFPSHQYFKMTGEIPAPPGFHVRTWDLHLHLLRWGKGEGKGSSSWHWGRMGVLVSWVGLSAAQGAAWSDCQTQNKVDLTTGADRGASPKLLEHIVHIGKAGILPALVQPEHLQMVTLGVPFSPDPHCVQHSAPPHSKAPQRLFRCLLQGNGFPVGPRCLSEPGMPL